MIISLLLFLLPLLAISLLFITNNKKTMLINTLVLTILNLLVIIIALLYYDPNISNFQFKLILFDKLLGGLDGISIWLILLVNLIIPIVVLDAWKTIENLKFYLLKVLLVNFWSNVVFWSLDLLLFYISFEAILPPMYFLIGYYGSRNKKIEEAQNKFFIYTLIGSLFLLISILALYYLTGTTDYQLLLTLPISNNIQYYLWFGFFIAFAIKTPMWFFHIWLPVAHGESSTGTSVILAAILLKLGSFGFIRYCIPLFPYASEQLSSIVIMFAIVSIIYSSIAAFNLIDLKSVIAYSSIAHMNVGVIGFFSNDINGISGAYVYSISHGFVSAGLFLLAGHLYERSSTKTIKYFSGLVLFMPIFITFFFLFSLSNISFP